MEKLRQLTEADLAGVAGGASGNIDIDPGGDPGVPSGGFPETDPFYTPF